MADPFPLPCPECGVDNDARSETCRLCAARLGSTPLRPRAQAKLLRRTDFMAAARANQVRTRQLIALLLIVGATLGYLLGWSFEASWGQSPQAGAGVWFVSGWGMLGAGILLLAGSLWAAIALRSGDRIVMALSGAHEVTAAEERQLHNVVEEMAVAAGVPKPQVYIMETEALNAFATGMHPSRAAVAVTRGLLQQLDRDELQGVIAHEMGHVVNWDIRYATAVSVLVGVIALVSDGVLRSMRLRGHRSRGRAGGGAVLLLVTLLFAALAPFAARLVQFAISRQREFLADATSVRLTRNADGLIRALEKLAHQARPFDGANRATQHLFIVNPFFVFGDRAKALLATHPPIERRIARLRNLGA